jgi:single-stranded-DNA-specific exonuclease
MPDPFVFIDMEKAVDCVANAIKSGRKIVIFGDYDVDGVASTAICINFLNYVRADCSYEIPDRSKDGYGINIENLSKHKDSLIIAVDCGSSAINELLYAKNFGIDIIVIDHHKMSSIPSALAIINPYRPDEKDDYKYLCAAGLVFMCIVGINRSLKESGFYFNKKEPCLVDYLDLVALATVCDVVNLIGLNRAFVSVGLKVIQQRKNLGIDALMSLYRGSTITAETISFFLGPKLNAAGRMSSADISVKLLTTKNPIEAKNIAKQLDDFNKKRQIIEHEITEKIIANVDDNAAFICSYHSDWHAGIIGIVAGRLKEKFGKPAIVISCDKNGKCKASCRSVDDLDISELVDEGIRRGIISSGGGHSMAAGFTIEVDKIDELMEFLKAEIKLPNRSQELWADCLLNLQMLSVDFIEAISVLEPFGMGNRYPKFVITNVRISSAKIVGENHIATVLSDDFGNSLRAISFKVANTVLGKTILNTIDPVYALGTLSISHWKGKKYISFLLEDISDCRFGA